MILTHIQFWRMMYASIEAHSQAYTNVTKTTHRLGGAHTSHTQDMAPL